MSELLVSFNYPYVSTLQDVMPCSTISLGEKRRKITGSGYDLIGQRWLMLKMLALMVGSSHGTRVQAAVYMKGRTTKTLTVKCLHSEQNFTFGMQWNEILPRLKKFSVNQI